MVVVEWLFVEWGFLVVWLEDIGVVVGVSGLVIYWYFFNKELLLVELLVGVSVWFFVGVCDVMICSVNLVVVLDGFIEFYFDFVFGEVDFIWI